MANIITRTGKSLITNLLAKTGEEPKVVAWGLNPNAVTAAATDVGLFEESAESRVAGTSALTTTSFVNDTYQVTGTLTATAERKITEAAVFNSTTKPFKTTVSAGSGIIGSSSSTEVKVPATYTPKNKTYIQVRGEVMKVEAGEGSTTLTVARGANGSTASASLASGDAVTQGNAPGPYSAGTEAPSAGASLFLHADLSVVTLNNGDSIAWTWNLQFN